MEVLKVQKKLLVVFGRTQDLIGIAHAGHQQVLAAIKVRLSAPLQHVADACGQDLKTEDRLAKSAQSMLDMRFDLVKIVGTDLDHERVCPLKSGHGLAP